MNTKALIIDDESAARETLQLMLDIYCPHVEVVGEAEDGKQALALLQQQEVNLLFLDINMPGMNGFEFLQQTGEQAFQVIITTAYDRYALKAIKYSAMDYLLKPIRIDDLKAAVSKAISMRESRDHRLEVFLEHYKSKFYKRLVVPHKGGHTLVNFVEILRAQADRNYTHLHLTNGERLLAAKSLKEFDELLTTEGFMRVHHSHLVNMNLIRSFDQAQSKVIMVDGTAVDVARSRKSEFLNRLRLRFA